LEDGDVTIRDIYRKAVEIGMGIDWRGQECLDAIFSKAKEDADKPGFDEDRLWNPYGDSRIACGDPDTEVRSVLVGIEIHPEHLLMASHMRQAGKPVDLCLSHHMSCVNRGLYYFDDILVAHRRSLVEIGVPAGVYDPVIDAWCGEVKYEWKRNPTSVARHLDLPLMNIHMPCDLFHVKRLRDMLAGMSGATLGEVVDVFNDNEEIRRTPYEEACVHGDASASLGKVYVQTGAGWSAPPHVFALACKTGIDTACYVWPNDEILAVAKQYNVNVIEVPHNSNDNFGINSLLDALIRELGPLTVYDTHEFLRVERG
jgi:hypothetical protein